MTPHHRGALALARKSLPVHPCRPNEKLPILEDWPNRATTDTTLIDRWWGRTPQANVAIATGGKMRLLVIDVDPDARGEASFAELERTHGSFPATVEAITPRAGRHLYFLVPDDRSMPGNSAGKLGSGIDTRGAGGYVLAPPSVVNGRAYTWSADSAEQIARAPAWLLDMLERDGGNGKATAPEEWLALITEGVTEGARNQSVARVAGLLFRRLVRSEPEEAKLVEQLVACFNAVKCQPPLGAEELKRTIDSIAAREKKRRGLS